MAVQAVPRRFIGAAFQAALAQCLSMANRQVALAMVFPVAGLRMQGRRPLSSAIEKSAAQRHRQSSRKPSGMRVIICRFTIRLIRRRAEYRSASGATGANSAMVMRLNTSHVHEGEPGIGKGVILNTVGGISEPITQAAQVRGKGSPVIRHLDRFPTHNRNTVGEAVFVRDTRSYTAPVDDDPRVGGGAVQAHHAPQPTEGLSPRRRGSLFVASRC